MNDLEHLLQNVLSDPESIRQALSAASSLIGAGNLAGNNGINPSSANTNESDGNDEQPAAANQHTNQNITPAGIGSSNSLGVAQALLPQLLGAFGSGGGNGGGDKKLNLLMAMKPFLSDSHQSSVEHAMRLVKIAKTAKLALKALPRNGQS